MHRNIVLNLCTRPINITILNKINLKKFKLIFHYERTNSEKFIYTSTTFHKYTFLSHLSNCDVCYIYNRD